MNEGSIRKGTVVIEHDRIAQVTYDENVPRDSHDRVVDVTGCFVLPGVIDTHVHFREPGLTAKADMESESRAAAWGGVTSFFDMPNTVPQTTTLEALEEKRATAGKKSHVNYSFFFGATNDNAALFDRLDRRHVPGIKLFMGSSTGNMLVDSYGALVKVFQEAARLDMPVMAHCEDADLIAHNAAEMRKAYGDDPPVMLHPLIRSEEACYNSTALAVSLARQTGARLHVAHVSTARELALFEPEGRITAEAVLAHLLFSSDDYVTRGTLIKCNPAVKTAADRDALRKALTDGRIRTVATDHAPHTLADKEGGALKAASGMPMIQFSLPCMLTLTDMGMLSVERVVELMCHQPATLFGVRERGFLREGYKADIAVVRRAEPWTVTEDVIQSKCGWSPLKGEQLKWRVVHTFCNGHHMLADGVFDVASRGEEIEFA